MSTALARGLNRLGVGEGSVVGLLCRDHRGLIIAMAACGKLGARFVLMNTGFAKPQFADVCERENVKAVLHDSEFSDLLDALPADLPRVLTWVDEGTDPPAGVQTIDDIIAANTSEPLPAPSKAGRTRDSHQRDDRVAEGRAQGQGVAADDSGAGRPSPVSPQGDHGHRLADLPRHRPGHLHGRCDVGQQGGHHPAVQAGAHPAADRRPPGRHAGRGPDHAAPHRRTRSRRHRQVRHVVAEGDRDRRVGADPRAVQPGAGHFRRCPLQHLRLHRVRIRHHRHP